MLLEQLKKLARAGLTVAVRAAIAKGLEMHPDADLSRHADRKLVTDTILLAMAETSEMTGAMAQQILASGFDETADDGRNPFMDER